MVKQTVDEEAPQPHQVKLEQFQESVNDVVHVQKSSKGRCTGFNMSAYIAHLFVYKCYHSTSVDGKV